MRVHNEIVKSFDEARRLLERHGLPVRVRATFVDEEYGDYAKTLQEFEKLVENKLRFSPEGGVELRWEKRI